MSHKIITINRKARYEYFLLDIFEAGIMLQGSEVKSLRKNNCSLQDAYVVSNGSELELINTFIPQYFQASYLNHQEKRNRKLLLHKREIKKIITQIKVKGLTAIPLRLYFKHGLVKLEFAIAKGKKNFDKRKTIQDRDWKRNKERILKITNK